MSERFSLSEIEFLKLRELELWLKSKGSMDDNRRLRDELHSYLAYVLRRFEDDLCAHRIDYISARALLQSQLQESVLMEAAE